ncbi:hypothetical protein [Erythrobacter sp. THAF29]|uniref:hypothetical protein n=1 Tax=Erythrobacter sp. THAF29 TaxID=2587851 RepID=UPI001267D16A|nr:hypothetical protein [Erythrobacter sp. THAF29]QFT76599.1 hypothetical protein FIU90_03480 [Erythrobacter sp. THAF29]
MTGSIEAFRKKWLARLNRGARTTLEHASIDWVPGLHSAVADKFVTGLGFKAIGFNWELLDASPDASGPRVALTQLTEAFANDISNPSNVWLGTEEARECARDFLAAFDPATRTVVSNRYDGLWNPVSGASVEWGFVAYDAERIALLLIADA